MNSSPENSFYAFLDGAQNPLVLQDARFAAHMKNKQAAHPRMGPQGFELHLFLANPT